ncbi:putative HicB family RNase H-like nuclease [Alkalihalobacillus xiaoxiensis]|uniref:HicB family RNase H-like nuclease n=1 Tax=Shouchella xiaoxiensis TaxID=766895 RepID=A0ABS2SS40_9BACI|nr:DNA-binding protein [Shouchella xiaoxiensis]MBM7838339.1 putative HicB family RNase H-like nuclease [Shouchella xiaoxiensis]
MAIGPDKARTNITFDIDLKNKLTKMAKEDNRSLNNLVIKVLQDYVREREKNT